MPGQDEQSTVDEITNATSWDRRVALIRRVPEEFGTARHQAIYSAIAERVYVPHLAPDFAYVHWREDYELAPLQKVYQGVWQATEGFALVGPSDLAAVLADVSGSLRIFRLLLGLTTQEFAASTEVLAGSGDGVGALSISNSRVKAIEAGAIPTRREADSCALVVDRAMADGLFPVPAGRVRSKIAKPDTLQGWDSVREYARSGVPLAMFLHQRHYGGAFRQLLDATSGKRGDMLEQPVEDLFKLQKVPHVRTGSHNQEEVAAKFGLTVKPAPDFVVFDRSMTLRGMLECKVANDGGTARDKAARYRSLRVEANRLGGVPVFAVLAGLGWKRTADALGPVVRDTDGRTFTLPTLEEMLGVQPFPDLIGQQATDNSSPLG